MSVKAAVTTSEPERRARGSAIRSMAANCGGLVVAALVSLLLTPVLVHGLGNVLYGVFILVSSLMELYGLLDLGMRSTVFRYVSQYQAANRRDDLDETFASAVVVSLAASAIVMLLAFPSALLLPRYWLAGQHTPEVFSRVVLILGAALAVFIPGQLFGAYLRAFRRFDLYNASAAGTTVVRALLIVIVLRAGHGLLAVAVVTLAVSVLSLAANAVLVRVVDPQACFDLRRCTWARLRELLSFGVFAFVGMTGDHLRFWVDSIVISRVVTLAAITPFNIAGRLLVIFRQFMIAISSPMAGILSETVGAESPERVRAYFLRATRFSAAVSLYCGLMLLFNGRAFIVLWVGSDYSSAYTIMAVLAVAYTIMLAQQPSTDLLLARARHRAYAWWTISEGVANLVLSFYWGSRYGLIGVALGTAVPMVFVQVVVQPWYTLRIADVGVGAYFRRALWPPLVTAAVFAAMCGAGRLWGHPLTLLQLAFSATWQTLLFAALALAFILDSSERRQLAGWLQTVGIRLPFARNEAR